MNRIVNVYLGFCLTIVPWLILVTTHPVEASSDSTHISYGSYIEASIDSLGDMDAYSFIGQSGERVIIRMDPEGIDTEFRGIPKVFGPSDTLLISDYDSWTNSWYPYNYGGRQVSFVDFELPEDGQYIIYARENDGDMISDYWLSLHCRESLRANAIVIP